MIATFIILNPFAKMKMQRFVNSFTKYKHLRLIILLSLIFTTRGLFSFEQKLNLSGIWSIRLDSADVGILHNWAKADFNKTIYLPGTTDDAGLGTPNLLLPALQKPQILHLTRKHSYLDPAWYQRTVDIPTNWKNKQITLKLERVIWKTQVWVDGKAVEGEQESLTTPHYFDLSQQLSPGKHTLVIRIDNRKKYDVSVNNMAHAYTNETQIMWNGVIGEISCIAENKTNISSIQVFPDISRKVVTLKIGIHHPVQSEMNGNIELNVRSVSTNQLLKKVSQSYKLNQKDSTLEIVFPMGENTLLWNEFHPNLYELSAEIRGKGFTSIRKITFGMRNLTNKNSHIQVNGENIFLRGTLECCIFPLKGYPPMEKEGWQKVFKTAKEWGLNHLRFHSWCPPQAAFDVADEMGFYLQIELPLWSLTVNQDKATNQFLYAEADRIIREYGNHPSFCFWSIGNELQPDFKFLNAFVDRLKTKDPRHLYTNTSYTFEKGHGDWPERNDDFFITQKTKKGWVRGQGVFESESPSFNKNYSASVDSIPVPIITHEIGQYAVYPNIEEIEKYKGVLDPLNFKAVKADLTQKGLIGKAKEYLTASGKLAVILYKEEIERAMKTSGISGFQLLDLQDFPGQGTALVGLLDAFWDSKGLISSDDFRSFCGPVVPLAYFGSPVLSNSDSFNTRLEIANYSSKNLPSNKLLWQLTDTSGIIIKSGELLMKEIPSGKNTSIGNVSISLDCVKYAQQLTYEVKIKNTNYHNQWKIWVYPSKINPEMGEVVYTRDFNEANRALDAGKKVLYNPDWRKLNGIQGKFLPVFWSPVHFPKQAATMGMLCNPEHPALKYFPTEMHTDWQWWDLLTNSKTLIVDGLNVKPIVEMVDNFVNNRKLTNLFEAKVGKGKLIYTTIDLGDDINNHPQAKQLLYSIFRYMNSSRFNPANEVSFNGLLQFESAKITDQKLKPTDIY